MIGLQLSWLICQNNSDPLLKTEWDVIIGADLVYNDAGVKLLGHVFKAFCRVCLAYISQFFSLIENDGDLLFSHFESLSKVGFLFHG